MSNELTPLGARIGVYEIIMAAYFSPNQVLLGRSILRKDDYCVFLGTSIHTKYNHYLTGRKAFFDLYKALYHYIR